MHQYHFCNQQNNKDFINSRTCIVSSSPSPVQITSHFKICGLSVNVHNLIQGVTKKNQGKTLCF